MYATGANQVWATIGPNVATPASSASLVGNGSFDGNLMGIRTNSSTITVASTGNSAAASYVNTARDGAHIYIGARNDAIQAPTGYGHYKGTIKAAACGTGMSLSQANAMFADVNAFQAELGRPGISQ